MSASVCVCVGEIDRVSLRVSEHERVSVIMRVCVDSVNRGR